MIYLLNFCAVSAGCNNVQIIVGQLREVYASNDLIIVRSDN